MIQLQILSGKTAGTVHLARRFPFYIGRAAGSNLRVEEEGVWEKHARLTMEREGFVLATEPEALATVNGEPARRTVLRNGDRISLGSLQVRFWLAAAPQRRLGAREALVWAIVIVLTLGQLAAIYAMH